MGAITVTTTLPRLEGGLPETLEQLDLSLPNVPANAAAAPMRVRVWDIPAKSAFWSRFIELAVASPDDFDREAVAAAILDDVWGPGRQGGGRAQVRLPFSWRTVFRCPVARRLVGLDRDELPALLARDEAALQRTEQGLLRLASDHEDIAHLVREALAPGAPGGRLDPVVYRDAMIATVEVFEAYKQARGSARPPHSTGPENDAYRRQLARRLGRRFAAMGITPSDVALCRRHAASTAVLFRASANSYIHEALAHQANPPLEPVEHELFRWMHLTMPNVGGGLQVPPLKWDPVLASFIGAISVRLTERLVYVYCADPGTHPAEWQDEVHRMVAAYLRLHGVLVDERRRVERNKKGGTRVRPGAVAGAADEGELTGFYSMVVSAVAELRQVGEPSPVPAAVVTQLEDLRVQVEVLAAHPDAGQLEAVGRGLEDLADGVADRAIARALASAPVARRHLQALARARTRSGHGDRSLQGLAQRLGCSRANVSRRLRLAVDKSLSYAGARPALAGLLRWRFDGMGLGHLLPLPQRGR